MKRKKKLSQFIGEKNNSDKVIRVYRKLLFAFIGIFLTDYYIKKTKLTAMCYKSSPTYPELDSEILSGVLRYLTCVNL